MKRLRGRNGKKLGILAMALGGIILLALIMPTGFWFFALGTALIAAGILLLRC